MFNSLIIESDAFLDMGASPKMLYIHLAMNADDDGLVNPRSQMRKGQAADDEIKILLAKRFVLQFESGVVVIKHWLIHNIIRADLYKETLYKKEKATLGLNANGAYTEMRPGVEEIAKIEDPEWLKKRKQGVKRTANGTHAARRLGNSSLDKVKEEREGDPALAEMYLMNIPDQDVEDLVANYDINANQLREKARQVGLNAEAQGKRYENYRALLAKIISQDFKRLTPEQSTAKRETQARLKATEIGLARNPTGVGATETEKWDTGSTEMNIDEPGAKYEGKKDSGTPGDMKSLKSILKKQGA